MQLPLSRDEIFLRGNFRYLQIMAQKATQKRKLVKKLRNKYRLVILNDDTFEEKLSLKLSPLNLFLLTGFSAIVLITATSLLIAFTPLREYIPGYSSTALKRRAYQLSLMSDSLEQSIAHNDRYLANIKRIIDGKPPLANPEEISSDSLAEEAELEKKISRDDSLLRLFVEEEERYNLRNAQSELQRKDISFFTPLKGLVTNEFSVPEDHLGIDVVAEESEVIKAAQDGMVVFAEWTAETGYVMLLQHADKFISVYKHNSALLKAQGERVQAGEPIAIVGNTGELSSGPHLHFELWFDGYPVDPRNYVSF